MKIQEDPTQLLDVPATHFECIEDGQVFDLEEEGYDIADKPVTSIDGLRCLNEDDDEDHPIELIHVSATPLASPSAVRTDTLNGVHWEGLDPFDDAHWHHGRDRFEYSLEEG